MTWKDMLKKYAGKKELREEILHHRRKNQNEKWKERFIAIQQDLRIFLNI